MTTPFHAFHPYSDHPSPEERAEHGRAQRRAVPRKAQGGWEPTADRSDPVSLLQAQETTRVPGLLPLRHERMGASAFAFYRGTANIMASDLASQPRTDLYVQACGDAHLSNFGLFAAPDRRPVFDLNDFDETNPGPFEWDLKRLATSFVLAAQDNGFTRRDARDAAAAAASEYRTSMARFAQLSEIDIWYQRLDADSLESWAAVNGGGLKENVLSQSISKASSRTIWTALNKLTDVVDGRRRFIDAPPLIFRVPQDTLAWSMTIESLTQYFDTLAHDRRALLERYEIIDLGHKVVGVGSVGLLAWVLLLQGRDPSDVLVLQIKQAQTSVLEPYTQPSVYDHAGERVVQGQRLIQAASDSFLGWVRGKLGREYYVRQLRDMKWSPEISRFRPNALVTYAQLCGHVLARAHARSGDAIAIAAYLGNSTGFDESIVSFSLAYADQVQLDFAEFQAAVADGRLAGGEATSDMSLYLAALRNPMATSAN